MRTKKTLTLAERNLIKEHLQKNYITLGVETSELAELVSVFEDIDEKKLNIIVDRVYENKNNRNKLLRFISANTNNDADKTKYTSIGLSHCAKEKLNNLKLEERFTGMDMSEFLIEIVRIVKS